MPVAMENSGEAAFDMVRASLDEPGPGSPTETDIRFLQEIMENNVLRSLVQVQDRLEESSMVEPISTDNIALVRSIVNDLSEGTSRDAEELQNILTRPHVRALIVAHDDVANKNYEEPDVSFDDSVSDVPGQFQIAPEDAIRMVGIRKNEDEPLGITVRVDNGELVIARIIADSMIDKQGLLHVGDIIKEVNGQEVATPEQLTHVIKNSTGSITLKVLPSYMDTGPAEHTYIRVYFTWDPQRDNLIPCKDAGLPFKFGEILQILNQDDAWWQAKKLGDTGPTGLIPSRSLEERRKAFVRPDHDFTQKSWLCGLAKTKKKRKIMYNMSKNPGLCGLSLHRKKKKTLYQSTHSSEFDKTDIPIYEEVVRMPPFPRKCIVLVGAQGVGRRTLKNRLINSDPNVFGSAIPHTSRPPREGEENGKGYYFVTRETMTRDIQDGKFLEHGEFSGNLYGTKIDSIRSIIRQGKICLMDIAPNAIKLIRNSEFMPYVIFIAAPSAEVLRNMYEKAKLDQHATKQLTYDRARNRGAAPSIMNLDNRTEDDFRRTVDESILIEKNNRHLFDHTIINDNMDKAFDELNEAIDALDTSQQWVPVTWLMN